MQRDYGWPTFHRRDHRQEPARAHHQVGRAGVRRARPVSGRAIARRECDCARSSARPSSSRRTRHSKCICGGVA
jgi:hypothetical protein